MGFRRPFARYNRGRVLAPRAAVAAGGGGDVTAPILQSATIAANGLSIALVYDEALDAGSVLAAGNWTLNGTSATVSSVGASGSTLTLTLGSAIGESETVTITTSASPVDDTSGNAAATLTGQATTNNSTVILVPILASNCLTGLHADSGPVGTPSTAAGNDVTDWISLTDATGGSGPYDWAQGNSSNRPVISDTTIGGGRRTIDGNGTTDFLEAVGDLAGEIEGDDTPCSWCVHGYQPTTGANRSMISFGNTASALNYFLSRAGVSTYDTFRADGVTTGSSQSGGTPATGEMVLITSFTNTDSGRVTMWVRDSGGLTKIVDNLALNEGVLTMDQVGLFAFLRSTVSQFFDGGIRQAYVWNTTLSDANATTLGDLYGT